jgi:predicted GIY-YIG superfamily endonuclease
MFNNETNTTYNLVYVLELEQGKYYVGISSNLNLRLYQHFNGGSCVFTRKYKAIRVVEILAGNEETENKKTEEYIARYGYFNVSGGKYVYRKKRITINHHIKGILLDT